MEKTASIEGNEYSVGIIGFRFTSAIYITDLHISESSSTNMNELWRADHKRKRN